MSSASETAAAAILAQHERLYGPEPERPLYAVRDEYACKCGGVDFRLQKVSDWQRLWRLRCADCRTEVGVGLPR